MTRENATWERESPMRCGAVPPGAWAGRVDSDHTDALRAIDDEHAEARATNDEMYDALGMSACRAHRLRVRPAREWSAEQSRRRDIAARAAMQPRLRQVVANFADFGRIVRVDGQAALRAALNRVQARCSARTLDADEVAQAIREALDEPSGSGSVAANHHVAGSYGYPVSYTHARAEYAERTATTPAAVVVSIDRWNGAGHATVVLFEREARRMVRAARERAAEALPVELRDIRVIERDSLDAGNCVRWTSRAVAALGATARAVDVYAWAAAHGVASFALRAIRRAADRQQTVAA